MVIISLSISFLHDTHPVLVILQSVRVKQLPGHTRQLVVYRHFRPVTVPPEPELVDPPVVFKRYRTLQNNMTVTALQLPWLPGNYSYS